MIRRGGLHPLSAAHLAVQRGAHPAPFSYLDLRLT